MAREPVVKIGSSKLERILSVKYSVRAGRDDDGRPTKKQRIGGITVRRVADDVKDVASWSQKSDAGSRQNGSVEFMHPDGKTMKTLKWEEGYVSDYKVFYDKNQSEVVEEFVITPRSMGFKSAKDVDSKWETGH